MSSLPQSLLITPAFKNLKPQRSERKSGAKKTYFVEKDQLREYLNKLGINESHGLDRMHPRMLRIMVISL